nr:hypothetical protein [Tanacetum cinerariifolium]
KVEEVGVEPEAEGADVELEAEEPDGVPEATIGTGSQRPFDVCKFLMGFHETGESSTAREPQFIGGLAPWALRRDLEALRRQEKDRVKFAMATLRGRALTWWNGRTKAMG